jgi:hypothetical protein
MTKRPKALRNLYSVLIAAVFVFMSQPRARAGGPVVWETDSRVSLLNGESRGVSVTDTGALMLAPQFTQLFDTEQAFVWSSAADTAGNVYLGTGHDGKIFRVTADGRGALLYDATELDVTALVVGRDGALYAGTSPEGKVYRVTQDGKAEVYFDPPDKYIWSLALMGDGSLAVGTGDTGKLYRVRAAGAKPEASLLVDTNETHIISLAADARGNLIAGTDPGGLVLRISPEGKVFALFDSPLREIHALALASDGSIYALALGDAATGPRASSSTTTTVSTASSGGTVTGTVTTDDGTQAISALSPQAQARSRNELNGARSAVFHISPGWRRGRALEFADSDGLLRRGLAAGRERSNRHERQGAHLLGHRRRARHACSFSRAKTKSPRSSCAVAKSSPRRRIRASSFRLATTWSPKALTSRPCATRSSWLRGDACGGAGAGRSSFRLARETRSGPT